MFIDSHAHLDRLDLKPFGGDFSRFMEEAGAQGVERMLCVSINLEDYPAMRRLIEPYPHVSVSVGVHPNETDTEEPDLWRLAELADDDRVVAIGETGLDYFRSEGDLTWQHERFRNHIRAAKHTGKPLIIHTRDSRADTLRILEEEDAGEVGGVFHCFTEDWETARRALDLNFSISFSGIVTFRTAETLQDVARRVPDDRFLIETDSPYLAPVPLRGKPNYPYHVRHVAGMIAELRGVSLAEVADRSMRNYDELFGNG
ncbi:TatD family hydrolase [Methylococcus geothermalis]|uniref:YchF/TatD family DNA exonuclease n=1 Tax=Methylococcus geothermalis TaxID=2681310 RepID=A0A858Q7K1_9GAMM|nr:TatD family hydrolase [Methylococcus geothermalis]QJD29775.1 YchF/TatD family DNA exonuclease [Methylococcus geothermalis]